VRYLEAGSGSPVLFIHAFPLSADQWLPQLARVPPGWRFVAADLRGFRGHGPAFEDLGLDGLTIDRYADDLVDLMSHLEIDRAVVVGISMGGYVAFALVRRAAARVAGLVLANTRSAADSDEGRAKRDQLIETARTGGIAAVSAQMLPNLVGETTRREQPDLVAAVDRAIQANTVDAVVAAATALKTRPDSTAMLPALQMPALVIHGAEDTIVPAAEAEAMAAAIPGARLAVLPRTGHLSNLEAPLAFNHEIDRFLRELGAARS
jgi:pimeloyl-ACP methyl ester carboxylesterase